MGKMNKSIFKTATFYINLILIATSIVLIAEMSFARYVSSKQSDVSAEIAYVTASLTKDSFILEGMKPRR